MPTTWTTYSNTFTPSTSGRYRVRFSSLSGSKDWFLDNISIVVSSGSGTNLLMNGNFESGPSIGWHLYSCSGACSGSIAASGSCVGNSGWCYSNLCGQNGNIQFLEQFFDVTAGVTYILSFAVRNGSPGTGSGTAMNVNIF